MNKSDDARNFEANRIIITRMTMLFFMASVTLRAFSFTLPYQLCNPILIYPKYDLGYILFVLSGLANFFAQNNVAALILSVLIMLLPVLLFLFPRKHLLAIAFSISWILMTAMNGVYGQHNSYMLFSILLIIPFCVKNDKSFSLLWEGLRYYGCWVYASTFILKLINGAFWQWDYGAIVLSEQTIDQVYWFPNSWHTQLVLFLNNYPMFVNISQKFVFLIEGTFIVGFFTKKYDRLLLLFALLIFITTTLFAMVLFVENLLIYCLIFIKPQQWQLIQRKLNSINKARYLTQRDKV